MDVEVRKLPLGSKEPGLVLASLSSVVGDRPPHQRVARQMQPPRFTVARPQLLAGSRSAYGSTQDAGEAGSEREVEPHDGVGASEHEVASTRVVAVGDPRVARGGGVDAGPKDVVLS